MKSLTLLLSIFMGVYVTCINVNSGNFGIASASALMSIFVMMIVCKITDFGGE